MITNIEYTIVALNLVELIITFSDSSQNRFVLNKDDVSSFVFKLDAVFNELLQHGDKPCQQ